MKLIPWSNYFKQDDYVFMIKLTVSRQELNDINL